MINEEDKKILCGNERYGRKYNSKKMIEAEKLNKCHNDKIKGGVADKKSPKDFDFDDLQEGVKVEMEHTDDEELAMEIAMDHLAEDKEYYKKLKKVEK